MSRGYNCGISLRMAYCCICEQPIDPDQPRISGHKGDANVSFCFPCVIGKVLAWKMTDQDRANAAKWQARYERDVAGPIRRALALRRRPYEEDGVDLDEELRLLGIQKWVQGDESFFFERNAGLPGGPRLTVGAHVEALVQEKVVSPKATVIKVLVYKRFSARFNRLVNVALLGNDVTRQPWMHSVWTQSNHNGMKGAARRSLEEAERWLLRMGKRDILVDAI